MEWHWKQGTYASPSVQRLCWIWTGYFALNDSDIFFKNYQAGRSIISKISGNTVVLKYFNVTTFFRFLSGSFLSTFLKMSWKAYRIWSPLSLSGPFACHHFHKCYASPLQISLGILFPCVMFCLLALHASISLHPFSWNARTLGLSHCILQDQVQTSSHLRCLLQLLQSEQGTVSSRGPHNFLEISFTSLIVKRDLPWSAHFWCSC